MKRALMILVLAGTVGISLSQVTPARRPYAPANSALANTNQMLRMLPTNSPGALTNPAARRFLATNRPPVAPLSSNRFAMTNAGPGTRVLRNPGFNPNVSRRNLVSTNLPPPLDTNSLAPGSAATNSLSTNVVSTNSRDANLTNSPASTRAMITPLQRQSINKLISDLGAVRPGAPMTAAQGQTLLVTLRAGALGSSKPSIDSLTKLVSDLASGWPARGFAAQLRAQLALDMSRVLNSENLSQAETQLVINDARRVFQTSGMGAEIVGTLGNDLLAIANEVQQVQPNPAPATSAVQP